MLHLRITTPRCCACKRRHNSWNAAYSTEFGGDIDASWVSVCPGNKALTTKWRSNRGERAVVSVAQLGGNTNYVHVLCRRQHPSTLDPVRKQS